MGKIRCLLALLILAGSAWAAQPVVAPLPGEGERCPLPGDRYFTYSFAAKPKLGVAVLRVDVFDSKGRRVKDIELKGESGMPEMPGAHDSGQVLFKKNKKGSYLLPVSVVMPGEWEVVIWFFKGKKALYRGSLRFKV